MDTIFDHLDCEWPTLSTTRHSRTALQYWAAQQADLRGHDDLDRLVQHINRRDKPAASDRALAALIATAADNTLAARTALQAMLPGLKAVAATLQRFEELDEIAATLAASCWQRIRCYPLHRRPSLIAHNILFDTRHQTIRHLRSTVVASALLEEHDQPEERTRNAGEKVIDLLAEAVRSRSVSAQEARLIGVTRLGGIEFSQLERATGTREATLRQQRLRAERRVAAGMT